MAAYDPKARRPPADVIVEDEFAPVDAILSEIPAVPPIESAPSVVQAPAAPRPLSVVGSPVPAAPPPQRRQQRLAVVAAAAVTGVAVVALLLRRRRH